MHELAETEKQERYSLLLNDKALLKQARAVCRMLGHGRSDPLPVRVAVEATPALSSATLLYRDTVYRLAVDHQRNAFPLPVRGMYYAKDEWVGLADAMQLHPVALSMQDEIQKWEQALSSEITPNVFKAIYTDKLSPRQSLLKLLNHLGVLLSLTINEDRTPTLLREIWANIERYLGLVRDDMVLLSQEWLYLKDTDPDRIVHALRDTHACYYLKPILETVHNVSFPTDFKYNAPTFYDILHERISVKEMVKANQSRENEMAKSMRESQLHFMRDILDFSQILRHCRSVHLPAVNRVLKRHNNACIRRSIVCDKHTAVLEQLPSRWLFSGPVAESRPQAVEYLIEKLHACAQHILDAGGPDHIADVYEIL